MLIRFYTFPNFKSIIMSIIPNHDTWTTVNLQSVTSNNYVIRLPFFTSQLKEIISLTINSASHPISQFKSQDESRFC